MKLISVLKKYKYKSIQEQEKHQTEMKQKGYKLCGFGISTNGSVFGHYIKENE